MGIVIKRRSHQAADKLKVIEFAKNTSIHRASEEFGIDRKTVRRWIKIEKELKTLPKTKCALRRGQAQWPEMEELIFSKVSEMRKNGFVVTRNMIRGEAIKWAFDHREKTKSFKASNNWCSRFLKRHNLVLRQKTKIAQKLPVDLEDKIMNFQKFIIEQRRKFDFPLNSIGNMDETPVQFDMVGNTTIDFKGSKTVTVRSTGHEKSRFTVVLSCLASGVKLKPMIIFKRKTMPKGTIPSGVLVHVQANGWMDDEGVKLWLREIWDKRPYNYNNRSLLVWDMFRSHLVDKVYYY